MKYMQPIGNNFIASHLKGFTKNNRIPHALLFVGHEGTGMLLHALNFAKKIICADNLICSTNIEMISHPDLHFIFPTVTTDDVKTNPKSTDYYKDWQKFIFENPYGGLFDWYMQLDVKNKQGLIRVSDASDILKTLALKAYEGGYKVMIIWAADKMNTEASNKILKILEEPTDKTVFILISENEEDLLQTIKSRCQTINFSKITEKEIATELVENYQVDEKKALKIAHKANGNFKIALESLQENNETAIFEEWFVAWIRTAFSAKGNAAAINNLILWSEKIAGLGRETQKRFLNYCLDTFRQALLLNYSAEKLVYFESENGNFALEKFAPFVNGNNINDIFTEISDTIYHIERNGNAKIILTDMSIKLTRFLHKK